MADDRVMRLERTRGWMFESELDTLLVYSYRSAMTAYWTGYLTRTSLTNASLLVITADRAMHFTRLPVMVHAAESSGNAISTVCPAPTTYGVASMNDLAGAATAWLGRGRGGRVGFGAYGPEAGVLQSILTALPRTTDVSAKLSEHLAPKTAGELERLHAAADVAQQAFDAGVAELRVGGALAAAVGAAESACLEFGASSWHCFAAVYDRAGRRLNAGEVEDIPDGSHVSFEVIPDYAGFCPEVISSIFLGAVPGEAISLEILARRALEDTLHAMTPCARLKDVFAAGVARIEDAGFARSKMTRLGHGTGYDNVEWPECVLDTDPAMIRPGTVVSVHPTVPSVRFGPIKHGGTVLVTATGAQPLFRMPRGACD